MLKKNNNSTLRCNGKEKLKKMKENQGATAITKTFIQGYILHDVNVGLGLKAADLQVYFLTCIPHLYMPTISIDHTIPNIFYRLHDEMR